MKADYAINTGKFLSAQEEFYLTNLLKRYAEKEPRNTLMLELLLNTGARPSELLALRARDVNFHARTVFLRGIKGSRDRDIPLQGWLFMRLANYMVDQGVQIDDPIFPIAYNTFGTIWRQYRPSRHKSLRSLRHTFAVKMFRASKDPRIVQKLLGHRYLSTTEVYLDFVYSQEEFRALIGE